MTSKNISVRKDIYDRLKSERRPGESFADVIDRLLSKEVPPLTKYAGVISEETAERMEKAMEELSELEEDENKGL